MNEEWTANNVNAALKILCHTLGLDYDYVISDKLTVNNDNICCIGDEPWDDRTELIMGIRFVIISYFPNVDFRSQVHEYFESKRREAV